MSAERRTVINLVGGRKSSGEPVHEEILVDREGAERYRVVATPAPVLGIAAGDIIDVNPTDGTFIVSSRGKNLAIQVYGAHPLAGSKSPVLSTRSTSARLSRATGIRDLVVRRI